MKICEQLKCNYYTAYKLEFGWPRIMHHASIIQHDEYMIDNRLYHRQYTKLVTGLFV